MKTKSTQQEVLLITGTRFSSRQCQDKKDAGNPNRLTDNEMLEDACWNGLIQSMLPEVFRCYSRMQINYTSGEQRRRRLL